MSPWEGYRSRLPRRGGRMHELGPSHMALIIGKRTASSRAEHRNVETKRERNCDESEDHGCIGGGVLPSTGNHAGRAGGLRRIIHAAGTGKRDAPGAEGQR